MDIITSWCFSKSNTNPPDEEVELVVLPNQPEVPPQNQNLQQQAAQLRTQVITNQIDPNLLNPAILNFCDNTYKPILTLSCSGKGHYKSVNAETVRRLIENGAQRDHIDEKWYGWEALHYAAAAQSPEILQEICNSLGRNKINTLTMLSENALHVLLLEHSSLEAFNISCENGQDLTMSRLISQEKENLKQCAEILVNAGIDINHTNFWNETPLLIAIKRKCFEVVRLLLTSESTKDKIDLDSCKDPVSGKTARELLKGRENLGVLPTNLPTYSSGEVLFRLLKAGNYEDFLNYNGRRISDIVDSIDGDNEGNSSCTLLQYCFRKCLIFWSEAKSSYECDLQDITKSHKVEVFCESRVGKCVQHLLDSGADVDKSLRKFEGGCSVLEAAIVKGYYPVVALILGRLQYEITSERFLMILKSIVKLLESHESTDLNNTFSIVLSRLVEVDMAITPEMEEQLAQILTKGVQLMNEENLLLLLKFRGSLCWTIKESTRNRFGLPQRTVSNTILEKIDPEILKKHLDSCVCQNMDTLEIKCHSFLKQHSMHLLFESFLCSPVLKELLTHLVLKILILRHWNHLRFQWPYCCKLKYFYLNLIFYVIFYLLLHSYILLKFNGIFFDWLYYPGWICLGIFIIKEVFQIISNFWLYIKEPSNYFEFSFVIVTLGVYSSNTIYVDIAEVMSILLANVVLLLMLLNKPSFAKFIIVLRTISFYLRYISFYFFQFVAFGICFYILFANDKQVIYEELPHKIFESIILFTGNLDYMNTPWKSEGNTTVLYHSFTGKESFSKLIFFLFVLFLSIILHNLLLGLLFIDVNNLHKDVTLSEQTKRAGFVVRVELFFRSKCCKFLKKLFSYQTQTFEYGKIDVRDNDKKTLSDDEKQNLDFILTKKVMPKVWQKVYKYMRMKINERSNAGYKKEKMEIIRKLEEIEEMFRNIQELGKHQ